MKTTIDIVDARLVLNLVNAISQEAEWEPYDGTAFSAFTHIALAFLDPEGNTLWECEIVGETITFSGDDGTSWMSISHNGAERITDSLDMLIRHNRLAGEGGR